MPYKEVHVPAEIALDYNGVIIYHAYKDGNYNDRFKNWYTTDPEEREENEFDIRDLPNYDEERSHEDILKEAIDNGEFNESEE